MGNEATYVITKSSSSAITVTRQKQKFATEKEAAYYALKKAADINSPNEVAGFIIKKSGKYEFSNMVQSPERDVVYPGTVPALASAVFHTHVNSQTEVSIGDERYGKEQRLNVYMYNTKYKKHDFRAWQDCDPEFEPIVIK